MTLVDQTDSLSLIHILYTISSPEVAKPLVIVNKSVKVNEREKIRVTCKAETKLFSKLYWLKDGKKLPQAVIVKPEVLSSSVTKSVLLIENATINDTGIYTCVGSGMRGDTVSTSATFTVRSEFSRFFMLFILHVLLSGA